MGSATKIHSQEYFTNLNYTLANEDTAMEVAMLPLHTDLVVSIAGSGSRILPLLSKQPKAVACVDVSAQQLALTEMRIEATRTLEFEDFALLLGYPHVADNHPKRKKVFESLQLSDSAHSAMYEVFEKYNWGSILYTGKWERTFEKLAKINRFLTRENGKRLFEFKNLDDQIQYFDGGFSKLRWALVLLLIGNSSVFNSLLYSGDFPKKNINQTFLEFYKSRFEHLFRTGLARQSYFLQLCFFGKILFTEGCPIEVDPQVFHSSKQALKEGSRVTYHRGNVFDILRELKGVGFFSFSDVPSYFADETEKQYLQWIRPSLAEKSLVVIRHYLHVTEGTDKRGYTDVTERFKSVIHHEKLGVYDVEVLESYS